MTTTTEINTFNFSDSAERNLLPALIHNRRMWVDLAAEIKSDFFKNKLHGYIFKAIKLYFDKYKNMPTRAQLENLIVKRSDEKMNKEVEFIFNKLEEGFISGEDQYYYDECYIFIKENRIKNAILESVDLLERKNRDDFLKIESKIKDAVNWNPDISLGIEISDVDERFKEIEKLSSNVVPSSWRALNMFCDGGFFGKELTIFAGTSSVGKSIVLDNIALFAWERGLNVVVISLELSETRKAQRIYSAGANIPIKEIKLNKDKVLEVFNVNKGNKLFIKEFPTKSISCASISNYLYQIELYNGINQINDGTSKSINLLIVDYLDLLKPIDKGQNTYEDQGSIGAELRAIAQENDFPVITASQFNRNAVNLTIKEINETNLGDSMHKMRLADTLIAIHATPEERANERINFKLIKNRNGVKDEIIPLKVDYARMKITDLHKRNHDNAI